MGSGWDSVQKRCAINAGCGAGGCDSNQCMEHPCFQTNSKQKKTDGKLLKRYLRSGAGPVLLPQERVATAACRAEAQ